MRSQRHHHHIIDRRHRHRHHQLRTTMDFQSAMETFAEAWVAANAGAAQVCSNQRNFLSRFTRFSCSARFS